MDESQESASKAAFIVIATLIPICCVCNFVGSSLLREFDANNWQRSLLCFVIGMLISEVCLLAIWFSLGSAKTGIRFLQCFGSLWLVVLCYLGGLIVTSGASIPTEAIVVFAGLAAGLFLLLTIPLWLYRQTSRTTINNIGHAEPGTDSEQFSIRFLLAITAFAAVLISLVSRFGAEDGLFSDVDDFGQIFRFFTFHVFLAMLIALPTVWIALGKSQFWLGIPILILILIGGPFLGTAILCGFITPGSGFKQQEFWKITVLIASYGVGVFLPTLTTLLVFRWLGFRLTCRRRTGQS